MDKQLEDFAKEIWKNKARINNFDDVYSKYNEAVNPGRAQGQRLKKFGYLSFLKRLQEIARDRKIPGPQNKSPWMQSVKDYLLDEGVSILDDYLSGRLDPVKFQNSQLKKKGVFDIADLEELMFNDFYHFLGEDKKNANRVLYWRIYLNVKPDYATEAMKYVVHNILDGGVGVTEVKIGGPEAIESRSDVIVIYLNASASPGSNPMQSVFNVLEEGIKPWLNVQGNQSKLNSGTPAMTERIWPGVSVGAEPSDSQMKATGQGSFGSVRAKLIFDALQKCRALTEKDFLNKIEEIFKLHQINPELPFA